MFVLKNLVKGRTDCYTIFGNVIDHGSRIGFRPFREKEGDVKTTRKEMKKKCGDLSTVTTPIWAKPLEVRAGAIGR